MLAFMDVTIKYTCSKHCRGYAPQPNGYEAKHIIKRMVVVGGGGNEQWNDESTAGADASVEVPKLHSIKLLIIILLLYTH